MCADKYFMKLFFSMIVFLLVMISLTNIQNIDAEKTLTVTQKCENTALHLFVTNQDDKSVKNVHIFDNIRTKVLASADDDGILVLSADLQDKILRVGGGSYPMVPFTAENCQPYEIQFEKTDQDLMIINHHIWSNFDSTQDYGDGEYAYTGFTGSYVTGDIVNLSEHNLTDIRITVTPFSNQLGTGESESWYPIKKILRPGEASPFFTNMGGGYDNYSIKIDYYEATSGMPEEPQVKISDIRITEDDDGVETLIINCTNTLEKHDGFRLLLLGYSENMFLESASLTDEFWMSKWDSSASDCITDGKFLISESTNYGNYIDSQYLEYAKNDRFEVFIMQNNRYDLFFEVQYTKELEDFNANQKQNALPAQTAVYSDYFPNSLTPKYIDVEKLKPKSVKLSENVTSKSDKNDLQKNRTDSFQEIPSWIKTNAEWWAQDKIDDATFVSGIQFLIKDGLLDVPPTTESVQDTSNEIPSWIKGNAEFWAQGLISDEDFLNGIQYLVANGIIQV